MADYSIDKATGHRVAELKAPAAVAQGGNLKVSGSYADVAFTIRQNRTARNTSSR